MSAVWTVAAREIRARRMVLASALVVGALLSLSLVALVRAGATVPDQALIALMFGTAFPVAIALGVGASMLSGEMSERRLGFYFSRPIPALHLWAGKVVGASAVVVIAFACIQASLFFSTMDLAGYLRILGVAAPILLFVMAVGHVVTSMYRARSPWFVADIVLAVASVAALGAIVRTIVDAGAFEALRFGPRLPILLAAGVAALLGGAAAQLAIGRTDARRGHLALSLTVWVSVLVILGGFAAWQRWLLGGTPTRAGGAGYPLIASSSGQAMLFRGLSGRAGFVPFYLVDTGSGAFLRIGSEDAPLPIFSADGRTAAWLAFPDFWEAEHWRPRLSVVQIGDAVRLASRASMPVEQAARWHTVLALHPDGRQAVVKGDGAVGLIDLETARVGASIAWPQVFAADVLPDGRIRLFQATWDRAAGPALVVAAWSPQDGSVSETLRLAHATLLTRRGDTAVAAMGAREKAIIDLGTGKAHRVGSVDADPLPRSLILADGRVALSMGTEVRITDAVGSTVATVPLPAKSRASALREPMRGQLAVGVWSQLLGERGTLFVDAATGLVSRREAGLLPAGAQSDPSAQAVPGSLASQLFTDEDGSLLTLEPGGGRRVIVAVDGGRE